MRLFWLAVFATSFSASGALAYQDCKALFPTDGQLEDRLTCLQTNTDEVRNAVIALSATVRALTGDMRIETADTPPTATQCLAHITAGPSATSVDTPLCTEGPGPNDPVKLWRLQPK